MSETVYANLLGNWTNLSDDPNCKMGPHMTSPSIWWEENAELYAPITKPTSDSMYYLDYININYKGKDYRINPIHIQIVSE